MFGFGYVAFWRSFQWLRRLVAKLFAAFTSWCEAMNHCHEVCTSNSSPDEDLQYVMSSLFWIIQEHIVLQYMFATQNVKAPCWVRNCTLLNTTAFSLFLQSAPTPSIWTNAGRLGYVWRCWGGVGTFLIWCMFRNLGRCPCLFVTESCINLIGPTLADYYGWTLCFGRPVTWMQVRLETAEALGNMMGLISRSHLSSALPRLLPSILAVWVAKHL